jgi:hypothetical protein
MAKKKELDELERLLTPYSNEELVALALGLVEGAADDKESKICEPGTSEIEARARLIETIDYLCMQLWGVPGSDVFKHEEMARVPLGPRRIH